LSTHHTVLMVSVGTGCVGMTERVKENRIRLISRDIVKKNTVFTVCSDHIEDDSHHEVRDYISIIPNNLASGSIAGVAVLPITREGLYGFLDIFRHPLGKASLEVVKGHVEANEEEGSAAVRELYEETGCQIQPESLTWLGSTAPEPGVIQARTSLFWAKVGEGTGSPQGELGHGKLMFFDKGKVLNLINDGAIEDASTLALLLKYELTVNAFAMR